MLIEVLNLFRGGRKDGGVVSAVEGVDAGKMKFVLILSKFRHFFG